MTEIAFACIVKSADELDDPTDPATWRVLGVTGKNLNLMGEVNTLSGFYLPDAGQFVTRSGTSVLFCYHTPEAALGALERACARYGEYRGRIAAAERQMAALVRDRTSYVDKYANSDGLSLAQAIEKI